MWTEREIAGRLGISAIAFPSGQRLGAREIARIREAGLTRVEVRFSRGRLDHHDRAQMDEVAGECRRQGMRIVSVHGPGKESEYGAEDEARRRLAVDEGVAAARAADELGAAVLVEHFGVSPGTEKTLREMLERLDGTAIRLTVENGRSPGRVAEFVRRIGSDRLGVTVDIGHARDEDLIDPFMKPGRAEQVFRDCGDRLFHVHLHDFNITDHLPPFYGCIRWLETIAALEAVNYRGELLFEVHGRPADVQSDLPLERLRTLLKDASLETLLKALSGPMDTLLLDRPIDVGDGPARPLARVLQSVLKNAIRGLARRDTDEVLAGVAAFPREFAARRAAAVPA